MLQEKTISVRHRERVEVRLIFSSSCPERRVAENAVVTRSRLAVKRFHLQRVSDLQPGKIHPRVDDPGEAENEHQRIDLPTVNPVPTDLPPSVGVGTARLVDLPAGSSRQETARAKTRIVDPFARIGIRETDHEFDQRFRSVKLSGGSLFPFYQPFQKRVNQHPSQSAPRGRGGIEHQYPLDQRVLHRAFDAGEDLESRFEPRCIAGGVASGCPFKVSQEFVTQIESLISPVGARPVFEQIERLLEFEESPFFELKDGTGLGLVHLDPAEAHQGRDRHREIEATDVRLASHLVQPTKEGILTDPTL